MLQLLIVTMLFCALERQCTYLIAHVVLKLAYIHESANGGRESRSRCALRNRVEYIFPVSLSSPKDVRSW